MPYRFLLLAAISFPCILITACKENRNPEFKNPDGYDLSKPYRLNLPIELDEISGIVFYPGDTSVFAINDEYGWLYKIRVNGSKSISKWKFSDGGDFEDLAMIDTIFYALKSNGNIVTFTFSDSNTVLTHSSPFPGNGNEFESLCYDSELHLLLLICKDCEGDKKSSVSQFFFDPAANAFEEITRSIDVTTIGSLTFKPSAAAIHPITRELYIISAVNELLIITDPAGVPRRVFPIDGKLFKQPEGITFTPQGDLIISNESAGKGVANLLFFKYHKKRKV